MYQKGMRSQFCQTLRIAPTLGADGIFPHNVDDVNVFTRRRLLLLLPFGSWLQLATSLS